MFSLIAAVDNKYGISKNGCIPWNCPDDMKFFSAKTMGHVIIMGRKTWERSPALLKNSFNVVITSTPVDGADMTFGSIDECVSYFSMNKHKEIFVIGGSSIYKQFIQHGLIGTLYITHVTDDYKCDEFITIPPIGNDTQVTCSCLDHTAIRQTCHVINIEEERFLDLLHEVVDHGVQRADRTGIGTLSCFGRELRFDLSAGHLPMITTRPLSLRIIFEELMWILRGQTDNTILQAKKIHIWDDNTSRKFLDSRGLHLPEGDIGASYGFQMRYFGAAYVDCKTTPVGGFDQLYNVINLIKTNPTSRRIVINLWNPAQLSDMALPPCVYGYQFYVAHNTLSCKVIQRSSDVALAGSHNCTSAALFTRLLCSVTGLKPGELIWSPGDIHVYLNQVDAVRTQLKRTPRPFPILKITEAPAHIEDFEYSNLTLLNYNPHKRIHVAMNA
jgi:dihydrofolate reductase/thymidylate synthase